MENLPDEVLSEIFIRLLAKQLAQLRSICKPWNALLSESSFIKSHLKRSIQNNDEILLFSEFKFPTPFTARLSHSPDLELTNLIKPPVIPRIEYGLGALIGSVNGLICFADISHRVGYFLHIWNPSLSAILSLPLCPMGAPRLHFAFGFDPKSDDYKVIKLESFCGVFNKVAQAEVYSLRKASWKKLIPQRLPSYTMIIGDHDSHVCVNDHLHWLGHTDFGCKVLTIVGFDLGEEAFSEIPLPDSLLYYNMNKTSNVLGVLVGKLCVMSCVRYGGKCEVWVMDEYGVAESWVKHRAFSQFGGHITPYGFTLKNEFLFQDYKGDDRFRLYDPVAAKTKTFKITSRKYSKMKFVEYVDSLVWVPLPNCEL